MPRRLPDREAQDFLAEPRIGVLSVASGDFRPPLTVPIWYAYRPGGDLTFFTGTQGRTARKTRLIERAGAVSFCVQHDEFPYKYVTVEGSLLRVDRPPSAEQVVAIASRYLPEDQARGFAAAEIENPAGKLVLFTIRPERWLSFDFGDETG